MKKINEMDFKLGSKVYTDQKLSPEDVLKLTKLYLKPQPITKLIGKKLDQRVKVANDLAALTGRKQLEPDVKSGKVAQLLVILKSNLVSSNEYVDIFKKLVELHKHVYKYLANASPEMRGSAGAARAATKDMKGEFDESVNEGPMEGKWVVYTGSSLKPSVVKVASSHRSATMLMKKLEPKFDKIGISHIDAFKSQHPNIKLNESDQIKGGKADGKTLSDVANHHNVDIDQLMKEFQKGIKVEMEHTKDPKIAEEIAIDHLWEMPDYYTKLATIDPHESVNEATGYTDQTGMKSSILDSPKFSNIFRNAAKELRWIRLPQVKIYKKGSGFVFTDGKREMVASYGDGDWKIIKNISNARKEIKDLYNSSNESLTESTDEPQVIKDIRDVLENGYKNIKDPVSGKKIKMDSFTASHIIKVYDSLNPVNKEKYASQSLVKMSNIAFKLLKK